MPTRNVNLTDALDRFVATKVKSGRYENASEVVRAGLRALEREEQQYEAKLAALRAAIDEGDASGIAEGNVFRRVRKALKLPVAREFLLVLGFGAIWGGGRSAGDLFPAHPLRIHSRGLRLALAEVAKEFGEVGRTTTIASLSIPWGFNKGDEDLGGYHLIWPRDLVENAGGLLAAGAHDDALRVLHYLEATQEADGHWAQNMWLDGR